MIISLDKIEYIFQLPFTWFRAVTTALNLMSGKNGISVDFSGDYPVISMGDKQYNYRPVHCAKPTFVDGNLTNIEFYTVSAFCGAEIMNSTDVTVDECECVAP